MKSTEDTLKELNLAEHVSALFKVNQLSPEAAVNGGAPAAKVYEKLNAKNLEGALSDLAANRLLAVVFKGAIKQSVCEAAVSRLIDHKDKETYAGAESVGRIGPTLYENQFGFEAKYWNDAPRIREEVRNIFDPHGSPIDQLQAMCDSLPSFKGANILRVDEQVASVGVMRYLDDGAEILPHTDMASWDMPKSLECQQVDLQVAVNVYLAMPEKGGEVTVYNKRFSKLEYDANRRAAPNEYALREDALPEETVTIRPEVGDLVLFNASLPHRVGATEGTTTRYTMSCFIGICRDRSIAIFS